MSWYEMVWVVRDMSLLTELILRLGLLVMKIPLLTELVGGGAYGYG
jgi:hypothetical protein